MRAFAYHRAPDVAAAVRMAAGSSLTEAPAQFLAGGTTILDLMKLDTMRPTELVDLKQAGKEFRAIREDQDGLYLGAFATMAEAQSHPLVAQRYPVIAQSLALAASPQIRNMATLGGNVLQRTRCNYFRDPSWPACNKRAPGSGCAALFGVNRKHAVLGTTPHCIATYAGDFAQSLIALGATVEIEGAGGRRTIAFADLHLAPKNPGRETILAPGEVILAFRVPYLSYARRSLYLKIRDRQSYEFALASAAVALNLEEGQVREARIALGGIATKPWRALEAEAALKDQPLSEKVMRQAADAAFAGAITHGGNDYKPELGRRTLIRAKWRSDMAIGTALSRLDGPAKVTGGAKYGSDAPFADAAYGYLVTSAIARGRIAKIVDADARKVPGLIAIFTHRNIGKIEPDELFDSGGYASSTVWPLKSDEIFHDGQIVALVVAETFEAAREAAHRLDIRYEVKLPSATFDSPGVEKVAAAKVSDDHEDPKVGDAAKAFAAAPVKLDVHYETATEHHNPLELFTTACAWEGGKLIVWESSQSVWGMKHGLAKQLGIAPDDVQAVSPFIGGAFGSRGSLTHRTAIVARAAKKVGRPIKLMTTRDQGFTIATYRAETRHHIKLGADREGHLLSLTHEGEEITSRPDDYMVAGTGSSVRLYRSPNVDSKVSIVHADRNTPGFMRSPPETPYLFALECAMDELSYALGMDPVALRKLNDTENEPIEGLPFTSRSLVECFDQGARAFGWEKRNPKPRTMRDGDWLVGWGTASSLYPSHIATAAARVTLYPDGTARIESATHELGTGIVTACAVIAADRLGLDPGRITVEVGDSALPPAPVSGGSVSTASVGNAVAKACDGILARRRAGANGVIEAYAEYSPKGAPKHDRDMLHRGKPAFVMGESADGTSRYAYGAQFVEVRVHRLTGEIRVPRALGAFAAGTIVNPKTAESQLMGGIVWGISAALHEETEIDLAAGRYYNDDLAEYLVPVNADIGDIKVLMLPEKEETINPLGIKGIGELGNVGMNAAVANAVYHATGVRVRRIPIRLEMLFSGLDAF